MDLRTFGDTTFAYEIPHNRAANGVRTRDVHIIFFRFLHFSLSRFYCMVLLCGFLSFDTKLTLFYLRCFAFVKYSVKMLLYISYIRLVSAC